MAKRTDGPAASGGANAPQYKPVNRWAVLGMGALLGFVFGTLMWLVTGAKGDWHVWLYLALTTAMLGAGVSAAFGASMVRKRGDRVSPELRRRKR